MKEIWKDIKNFEGQYQVSNLGNVRSLTRFIKNILGYSSQAKGKNIVGGLTKQKYRQVVLWENGKSKHKYVHRLVAETFIPNPENLPEINHINHIRDDNRSSNLEWCTKDYNMKDMAIHTFGEYKDSHGKYSPNYCRDCKKQIGYKSTYCKECSYKHFKRTAPIPYKNGRPLTSQEISEELSNNKGNFTKSAEAFNMTDNSLRRWCKKYNLPTHSPDWK